VRRGRVIVVGSVNVDLVATVGHLPAPGETVIGGSFGRHHGGKGGNQATAAARLGSRVAFVGAVGDDPFGDEARAALVAEGIDVAELATLEGPTGVALILVDDEGENLIAVASGANASVSPALVSSALGRLAVGPADVVVVSHEIPTDAAIAALRTARDAGATTILNPAPANGLASDAIAWSEIVVPNEGELRELVEAVDERRDIADPNGLADVVRQAAQLLAPGQPPTSRGRAVVVTRGPSGATLVRSATDWEELPAPVVVAVDATGAGDTYVGALAAGLADGLALADAARRAVAAATLSTTKPGARGGMPTRDELEAALSRTRAGEASPS
jgi:ribokinase